MYEGKVRSSDVFSISVDHGEDDSILCRTAMHASQNTEDIKFEINTGAIIPAITPPLIQHMTKEQVEELIRCNPDDNRFEFLPNVKGKSKAWQDFKILLFEGIPQDFARCNLCSAIVTYSNRTGTGALLRHKCSNFRSNFEDKMKKVTPFIRRKKSAKSRQVSEDRKRWIIEKEAKFVINDLLPVKIVEASGFRSLAQALIDVGADYGKQRIDDVLVDQQTIVNTYFSEMCGRIKNDITGIMLSNTVSFTCDLWTSGSGEKDYLTLEGHVVLDNFKMKRFILGTRQVINHTPESMHNVVINILSEYVGDALSEAKLREGTIIRDNQANLVESFQSYTTLSCACHMLNSVIRDVLHNPSLVEFNDMLTSVRKNATLLDQYKLTNELSRSLTNCDTSWDLIYYMLRDIHVGLYEMPAEIQTVFFDRDESSWFQELDRKVIKDTIEFLDLFKDCSESLSTNSRPTLHEVVLWKMKIENHCKPNVEDSKLITDLKKEILHQFRRKFSLHHLHYVALFLDPNFKKMKKLNEEERKTTLATIKGLLKHTVVKNESATTILNSEASGCKKRKLTLSESNQKFRDFKDSSSEDEETNEITEVNHYMARKFGYVDDVLAFWKANTEFPNLRQLVRRVLNIPASSASSEKLFLRSAQVLNKKRAQLSGDNVDELLFLHHNLDC